MSWYKYQLFLCHEDENKFPFLNFDRLCNYFKANMQLNNTILAAVVACLASTTAATTFVSQVNMTILIRNELTVPCYLL
jgi:hypothetical protein